MDENAKMTLMTDVMVVCIRKRVKKMEDFSSERFEGVSEKS